MKTSKPFSCISYNTDKFLFDSLSSLVYTGYLDYFEFINHKADTDETKPHKHVYIQPAKCIDTEIVASALKEFDRFDDNGDKLFFTIHYFKSSKFGEWYWYGLHDVDYLKSKMLERNFHYSDSDIVSFDYVTHYYLVNDNPLANYCFCSDLGVKNAVYDAVSKGVPLNVLLKTINVPLGKVSSVIQLYNALSCYSPKNRSYTPDNHPIPTKLEAFNTKVNQRISEIKSGIATPEEQLFVDEIF